MKRLLWLAFLLPTLSFGQDVCPAVAADDWCNARVGPSRAAPDTQKVIRDAANAEHTRLVTEKAVRDAIGLGGGGITGVVVKTNGAEPDYDGSDNLFPQGSTVDITNWPDNTIVFLSSDADGDLIIDGNNYPIKATQTIAVRKLAGVFSMRGIVTPESTILVGTLAGAATTNVPYTGAPETYGFTAMAQSATAWVKASPTTFTVRYEFGSNQFVIDSVDASLQGQPFRVVVDNY